MGIRSTKQKGHSIEILTEYLKNPILNGILCDFLQTRNEQG